MRLGLFGCYDPDAPRLATLLSGLDRLGVTVVACREPGWGVGAASRHELARAPWRAAGGLAGSLAALWRRRHELAGVDALLVPYPGQAVMPLARRVADGLGVKLAYDPFLSLYDTAVGDRRLYSPADPRALGLRALDTLALELADVVLADTPAMAGYYAALAGVKAAVVPVGADEALFRPAPMPEGHPVTVLFVGHMLPLHGVETILEAARLLESDARLRFQLVGRGPVDVERLAEGLANVTLAPGVPYPDLPGLVARAGVCLGAFGASEKASRVVPHKVYEAAAVGRPVVTREGPAMDEAFPAAVRVPAADPRALADALSRLAGDPAASRLAGEAMRGAFERRYTAPLVAEHLLAALEAEG